MSRVCRSWRQVSSEPILWREVNLSAMSIECPRSANDSTIEKLACSRLKAVKELSLDGWSELTDTGLKAVGKHCRQLQSIVLSQCGSLSPKGITSLATKCRQLKMFDVAMTKIDISCLHRVTKRLGSQLEELCLMNCSRLGGEQVLPIIQENCPNLTALDLTSTNIRKLNVEKLQAGCPKLKELFVANLLLHSTPISTEVEQNGFPQLETLCLACGSLAGVPRTDRFLYRILRTSVNLKKLDVRGLQRISPEGIQRLPATSLEELFLSDTRANFATMSVVIEQWHHSLEILDISSNSGVGDESMELLRDFGMPKLYSLDLGSTNVTAEGVRKALNACPRLQHLNLTSCRGVPRGLKQWHAGAKLRNLIATLEEMESGTSREQHESE
ncbi:F-box/LRR-repeat protein 6-like [Orbicella faveolata]|uniref:F-box/LRR-repeat protein 6-like n=1 Tax=Orbicella faveolata TaxID=48498 RepID=UPI0009E27DBB|nr:F-box/LRR-repeat protein 6-like [Orbicella faveolata]